MDMKEMFRITQLLKSGGITEATETIRRSLNANYADNSNYQSPQENSRDIIEGSYRVIDEDVKPEVSDEDNQEHPSIAENPMNKFADLRNYMEQFAKKTSGDKSNIKEEENFIDGSFPNHIGTRGYKLYIPKNKQVTSPGLIVMLHGCTQDPADFARGTQMNALAEEHQCYVLYPAQSQGANNLRCWNWFNEMDQKRGQGEPCIIAEMTQQIIREFSLDANRVYVAGLSAGGAMAAILGITYPDIYAAVGVHSGLPYGIANDLPSALAAMKGKPLKGTLHKATEKRITKRMPPMIVFHGDQDSKVHSDNGDQLVKQHIASHVYREHPNDSQEKPNASFYHGNVPKGHRFKQTIYRDKKGKQILEHWSIEGAGHTWSGGNKAGSHTDPRGPDASKEMMRFFLQHRLGDI